MSYSTQYPTEKRLEEIKLLGGCVGAGGGSVLLTRTES